MGTGTSTRKLAVTTARMLFLAQTMELNRDGESRGPPPDPLIGRLLLHYRVLEAIGQGGMSVVYRGRDEHLARDVAIKVLHPFLRDKAECRTRLAREARAVARLEHPNIVKVFDFSGDRSTLDDEAASNGDTLRSMPYEGFIVCELVKGPTLRRHAEKNVLSRCPEIGAMAVWQLALALHHAHHHGVVHRDLKPENIMVRDDGVLKLMDFGIAHIADQGSLTVTGTLLGSPAHMAPECIDGLPADERSDLFSLGTVLYWVCTGALPFEALTPHALLKLIVDGKVAPAQQKSPRVSDDLARVIHKSIATRPADRFASALDFAAALADVLEKSGLPADSSTLRRVLGEPGTGLQQCSTAVRSAFLERAERALSEGATARALSSLNRVLADNAADLDARALLDRLDIEARNDVAPTFNERAGGFNDTAAPALSDSGPSAFTGSAFNSSASGPFGATPAPFGHRFTPVPGGLQGPPPPASTSQGFSTPTVTVTAAPPRWQSIFVAVAAVGLVVAAVGIARAVDDAAAPHATDNAMAPVEGMNPVEDLGISREIAGDVVANDNSAAQKKADGDKTNSEGMRGDRRRPRILPVGPMVLQERLTRIPPVSTVTAAVAVETRTVKFRIKPWADIIVDGVTLARGKGLFDASVALGDHVAVFVNPKAKELSVPFSVPNEGVVEIVRTLEPRPALLVVRCNVKDAVVDLGAGGIKSASDSEARPLVVPLGVDSRVIREVFIFKKGFVAYRKKHVFSAGDTLQLDVVLKEEAVDADKDPPVPPAP